MKRETMGQAPAFSTMRGCPDARILPKIIPRPRVCARGIIIELGVPIETYRNSNKSESRQGQDIRGG